MSSALIRRLGIGRSRTCPFSPQLTRHDMEATYFDEGVRSAKQKQLEEKLLQLVHPAYQSMLGHIRSGTLDRFKDAFHKALNRGDEFSVAACDCTESFTSLFDEGCADMA
ncbi:unnamed protein product [Camellia sinensis]